MSFNLLVLQTIANVLCCMYIISNWVTILQASHNNPAKDDKDYYTQMFKERPWCAQGKYISGQGERKLSSSALAPGSLVLNMLENTSFLTLPLPSAMLGRRVVFSPMQKSKWLTGPVLSMLTFQRQ